MSKYQQPLGIFKKMSVINSWACKLGIFLIHKISEALTVKLYMLPNIRGTGQF